MFMEQFKSFQIFLKIQIFLFKDYPFKVNMFYQNISNKEYRNSCSIFFINWCKRMFDFKSTNSYSIIEKPLSPQRLLDAENINQIRWKILIKKLIYLIFFTKI